MILLRGNMKKVKILLSFGVIVSALMLNGQNTFSVIGKENLNKISSFIKVGVTSGNKHLLSMDKLKVHNSVEIISDELRYKILSLDEILRYDVKSEELFKSFKKDVKQSLREYIQDNRTIMEFVNMNNSFGEIRGMKIKDIVANIDDAISKYTLTEDIVAFRATKKKYYEGLKVGDEFKSNVYYSTSLNKEIAKEFLDNDDQDILLKIYVPKNSKVLYIGNSIMDGNENELLLARNTKYKIISIEGNNMVIEVISD